MLGFKDNKPMTPRPEDEKKFSLKNKLDRKMVLISIIAVVILLAILGFFIWLYYFLYR